MTARPHEGSVVGTVCHVVFKSFVLTSCDRQHPATSNTLSTKQSETGQVVCVGGSEVLPLPRKQDIANSENIPMEQMEKSDKVNLDFHVTMPTCMHHGNHARYRASIARRSWGPISNDDVQCQKCSCP